MSCEIETANFEFRILLAIDLICTSTSSITLVWCEFRTWNVLEDFYEHTRTVLDKDIICSIGHREDRFISVCKTVEHWYISFYKHIAKSMVVIILREHVWPTKTLT